MKKSSNPLTTSSFLSNFEDEVDAERKERVEGDVPWAVVGKDAERKGE